ncbi:MAG: DUF3082 domain-containing protein [Chloroflexaceae bacterium]|nr:DUF3082 domain-containing protein [Chloroflexaceae bacterium]
MTLMNQNPSPQPPTPNPQPDANPWRYLLAGLISGSFGVACYFLTTAVSQTFASKPIAFSNYVAVNIAIAVRTLVIGIMALGTGVFGLVGLGLIALTGQVLLQRLFGQKATDR